MKALVNSLIHDHVQFHFARVNDLLETRDVVECKVLTRESKIEVLIVNKISSLYIQTN